MIVVQKPHHEKFIQTGWGMKSETDATATFEYSCRNGYKGDDETVVHTLWAELPEGIEDHFEIDWENSVY